MPSTIVQTPEPTRNTLINGGPYRRNPATSNLNASAARPLSEFEPPKFGDGTPAIYNYETCQYQRGYFNEETRQYQLADPNTIAGEGTPSNLRY